MYHLATAFPIARRVRLPLSRDQLMLLMAAINEIFLGIDIYLAHSISGTIVPNEWIPILFGPAAGVLLLLAGLIAFRQRPLATVIATLVFVTSIGVGLLGAYFHLVRAILPNALPGQQVSIDLLVWAPPILGPLMFALVGVFGLSAAWVEDPPDSGELVLLGGRRLRLPYSKTRAYFFIVGMAALATVISSVLDHARANFANPWLWAPTIAGIFGAVIAVVVGALDHPRRPDLILYTLAMLALIAVGVIGALLHVNSNLIAQGTIVGERFVRGAPFLAPLLFANVGTLGLIALLPPSEEKKS
ncbi:MAG TPA: hypothetical protein VJG32_22250 [Anaerolineae bacterium]|nr:hypothetical protein [Anaerolineae bacterium]